MSAKEVTLDFQPRSYQQELYTALASGYRHAVCVWHRRAGKDLTAFNWTALQAIREVGIYYLFYPTYAQGKKILWNGQTKEGRRFIHYIPDDLVHDKNETEMLLKVRTVNWTPEEPEKNISLIQVIGTDKMDSIVGTNPKGCVFSEYSIQNPRGYDLVRPILRENQGWAIFIYTPRGRNHGWRLFERAAKRQRWYCSLLTVNDTLRDSPTDQILGRYMQPVVTEEDIEEDEEMGMDPDLVQQEYYCSFAGAMQGAYFGHLVEYARRDGRLGDFAKWDPNKPVHTAWDIGKGDDTVIWFWQHRGAKDVNLIDHVKHHGRGLPYYAKILKEKPYAYGVHFVPHDAKVEEWTSEQKRTEAIRNSIGGRVKVCKKLPKDEQIDQCRRFFHRFHFNINTTGPGIDAIASYKKEYDEKHQVFRDVPCHDWASHDADALMCIPIGYERPRDGENKLQTHAVSDFDPMNYEQSRSRQSKYKSDFDPMEG